MNSKTRSQKSKISRLVWALAVMGIGVSALMMGLVYFALTKVHTQRDRARVAEMHAIASFRALRFKREAIFKDIETHFNGELNRGHQELQLVKELAPLIENCSNTLSSFPGNDKNRSKAIQRMEDAVSPLLGLCEELAQYEKDLAQTREMIQNSWRNVRTELANMKAATQKLEGMRRLRDGMLLRKYREADREESANLAFQYIEQMGSFGRIRTLHSELNDLALLAQRLYGETDIDQLVSLKDNEMRQTLRRLSREAEKTGDGTIVPIVIAIQESLFGKGIVDDSAHQTLIVGQDGLFSLQRQKLELQAEGIRLHKEVEIIKNQCLNAERGLDHALSATLNAEVIRAESTLQSAWQDSLTAGIVLCSVFLILSWRVSVLGRQAESQLLSKNKELEIANLSMRRLTAAMEQSRDGIAMIDMKDKITFANKAWAEMHHWDTEEVLGKNISVFHTPEQMRAMLIPYTKKVLSTGSNEGEVGHVTKEGLEFPTWMSTSCLKNHIGEIVGLVVIASDITERKRAEQELKETHKKLVMMSHLAGMSEVATGILHNVGNVLNSVNVSTNLLEEKVRDSRVAELKKAGELVAEHASDIGTFVTNHPQGQHLAKFIVEVSKNLHQEQQESLEELVTLRNSIGHIKEIVAMQQSRAGVKGASEEVSVVELAEDALRMRLASFERHEIEIVRDFEDIPLVQTERHKVVQILVNLIGNAKHAISDYGCRGGRITLRIYQSDEDRIRVQVTDSGIGIPKENLKRIFSFGFTTKADGHGFGLHSSVLAAKELGGTLSVQSEGEGLGASFTLELPILDRVSQSAIKEPEYV